MNAPLAVSPRALALDRFARRHRLRWWEAAPWIAGAAGFFVFPDYLALGAQIFATILFALSLDLVLGFAGVVTLGHAAFFGVGGYAAGLLAAHGFGDPTLGLLAAALAAGLVGLASGALVLRTRGLTLLMQTLVVAAFCQETANRAGKITGGADGLSGVEMRPVLGLFRFDLYGETAYVYTLVILFLGWLVARALIHSAFGRSLVGVRENAARMSAIGAPVFARKLVVYAIAAALAGVAGALLTQTTAFVGLDSLSLSRSGAILIMLIIGGVGRLYGAFIGVPLYMIAQDQLTSNAWLDPVYWPFWIGLFMVLLVTFARGGVLGLLARLSARRTP